MEKKSIPGIWETQNQFPLCSCCWFQLSAGHGQDANLAAAGLQDNVSDAGALAWVLSMFTWHPKELHMSQRDNLDDC